MRDALKAMREVKGLAIGAFGELSANFELLIESLAHEGAVQNSNIFASNEIAKNKGIIAWFLKRRWSRVAVITVAQCRNDGMAYVGGSAQQQAAQMHEQRNRNLNDENYDFDSERLNREYRATNICSSFK